MNDPPLVGIHVSPSYASSEIPGQYTETHSLLRGTCGDVDANYQKGERVAYFFIRGTLTERRRVLGDLTVAVS